MHQHAMIILPGYSGGKDRVVTAGAIAVAVPVVVADPVVVPERVFLNNIGTAR